MLEPSSSGAIPWTRNSRFDRKRVSQWNSPSVPPDVAPMSPWLSSTMKLSPCFKIRRGRDVSAVAGM